MNHCELHRTACVTGKKIGIDWDKACLKKKTKMKGRLMLKIVQLNQ